MYIKTSQIRAARSLLNWHQKDLADRAGVSKDTVVNIESGKSAPHPNTQKKIIGAFERAGIEFIDGGVREAQHSVRTLVGQEGFLEFFDDISGTLENSEDRNVCVSNVDEREFEKWLNPEFFKDYKLKILDLNVSYKILIQHGDTFFFSTPYADYRWMPKGMFYSVPTYIYGDKFAVILFEDTPRIYIIEEPKLAKAYQKQFDSIWEQSSQPETKQ